ncbi:MAG: hypothetical protein AAGI72_10080 [Pseudomonadota bacterium]
MTNKTGTFTSFGSVLGDASAYVGTAAGACTGHPRKRLISASDAGCAVTFPGGAPQRSRQMGRLGCALVVAGTLLCTTAIAQDAPSDTEPSADPADSNAPLASEASGVSNGQATALPGSSDIMPELAPAASIGAAASATGIAQDALSPVVVELESEARAREALMLDVRDYQQAIAAIEAETGAFAPQLSEQLLGLGLALQRNGDHEAAVQTFKRGVHLARINEGLYSQGQLALLQGEIASHVALGAFTEADERQRYLYRVQARTLSDSNRGEALMQHALWQRQAYEAGIGEEPVTRLTRMWSLYRLALTEYVDVEGESSTALLPPLYGMLRAQYLLSGFVGETSKGRYRTRPRYVEESAQQTAYSNQSYKQGNAVIRAIYDVRVSQDDASIEDSVESLLMLADWKLWHGKRNEALETYGRLYTELAENEAAKAIVDREFAEPHALPKVDGVRALPPPVAEREGVLLLEFDVTDRGRVVDLERLDEHPQNDARAEDIMRRLRQTPFRPSFSDGMPVRTEGIRWAYDVSIW